MIRTAIAMLFFAALGISPAFYVPHCPAHGGRGIQVGSWLVAGCR